MQIVFFGTPDYVVPILESLHKTYNKGHDERGLIAVVTQPPKITGRSQYKEFSPVDDYAHKHKIDVITDVTETPNADLGVCAAYGKIIPSQVEKRFNLGILNIHPSLLPVFRGASPTQAAIVAGLEETGISIIKMDEMLDHGPIVSQVKSQIYEGETNGELRARLFNESIDLLNETIAAFSAGKIKPKEQDHEQAIFTTTLTRDDGFISPELALKALAGEKTNEQIEISFIKDIKADFGPDYLERLIRALDPWPGVWTNMTLENETKRIKFIEGGIVEGKFLPTKVQLEGKNEVSWKQFLDGYPQAKLAGAAVSSHAELKG